MPAVKVKSKWVAGNLVFYDKNGDQLFKLDGNSRIVDVPTGSTINIPAASIPANSIPGSKIEDVSITGAQIANATIAATKLANGAGLGALVAAGLGASAVYTKDTDGVQVLSPSDIAARTVLLIVVCTQDFDDGTGTKTAYTIGEVGAADKYTDGAILATATAGDVFTFAGSLTASANLIVTATKSIGNGTGAIEVTALILPA